MAIAIMSWLLAIPLLGMATGLRSTVPMATLCWFAWLGYLPVQGTWAAWTARIAAVALFTVLALAECAADKFSRMLDSTAPGPLTARLVFGGLVGSIAATAMNGQGLEGVLLGVVGAALGAFAGSMLRREMAERMCCAEWPFALAEDLIALLCAFFALRVVTN